RRDRVCGSFGGGRSARPSCAPALMKIKLDENLPVDLLPVPAELGHDVHTRGDEGLCSAPDDAIWKAAQREERFLITQDLDSSDARRFAPGTQKGSCSCGSGTPA